ncbi:MAG: fibronectin, type III protein [uncultured bacterium]|nr:MAG: fibronectin, type III protein [uncultured bacterium]
MKKITLFVSIILVSMFIGWQIFLRDLELDGKAKLNWNTSVEENVTGYKIYYGTLKRTEDCPRAGYAKKIEAGNNTSYEIKNLKDGQTYYFSVTSVNSAGKESCFSEEMSKEIRISLQDKIKSLLNRL